MVSFNSLYAEERLAVQPRHNLSPPLQLPCRLVRKLSAVLQQLLLLAEEAQALRAYCHVDSTVTALHTA